jgi:type II secretory pathway component HofQ
VPSKLITKPSTLRLNTSLCNRILDFLTGRSQVLRVGNNTSAMLILNTYDHQRCVLSLLLYSLFTDDCTARHDSNTIIKFADDTTVVDLINDETAYREEIRDLTV